MSRVWFRCRWLCALFLPWRFKLCLEFKVGGLGITFYIGCRRSSGTCQRTRGAHFAFQLFHWIGSLCVSESSAESTGSVAKAFCQAHPQSLASICERTLLKSYGMKGDGSDDISLQRCRYEFFGSVEQKNPRVKALCLVFGSGSRQDL